MKITHKILVIFLVASAVAGTLAFKAKQNTRETVPPPSATEMAKVNESDAKQQEPKTSAAIPKLVDLGADKCIPCKAMAPILEELKREYEGKMDVQFIDVWKNPNAGKKYGVQSIPTQIFYDASGKELFRHIGFFGKEDILGKWKELGIKLSPAKEVDSLSKKQGT